jgi:hypothetical protein
MPPTPAGVHPSDVARSITTDEKIYSLCTDQTIGF